MPNRGRPTVTRIQSGTASVLDLSTTTVGGVCLVVVTDRPTGKRYFQRDPDPCGRERRVQLHQSRWGSCEVE